MKIFFTFQESSFKKKINYSLFFFESAECIGMDYVRKETNAESFSIEFYFFQLMGKLNSWAPDQSARCFSPVK